MNKIKKTHLIHRVILMVVITCLLISSSMILLFGENIYNVNSSGILTTFIWITVMAGIWIILLSTIILVIVVINYRLKKREFWKSHKVEVFLSVFSILGLLTVYFSNLKVWTQENVEQVESDFFKYIVSLDQIPLPLNTNPLGSIPELSKEFDKSSFQKYKHIGASWPLGICYKDEKIIAVIDCSIGDYGPVPFLTTYDLEGNKIDSTGFYKKSGQDMGYWAIEYLTFKANRTIVVLDTVKLWNMNEEESDVVEESMKMTTGKMVYRVLGNGNIEAENIDH